MMSDYLSGNRREPFCGNAMQVIRFPKLNIHIWLVLWFSVSMLPPLRAESPMQGAPIETTGQLAAIVRGVKKSKPRDIDPATLTFQALRIAANEELVGLDRFIDDAVSVLESGARIAVISFHSLEDRIVKRALRRLKGECTCPPGMPVCGCGAKDLVSVLTGRPVTASEDEGNRNPRSRSAKLRIAEKK